MRYCVFYTSVPWQYPYTIVDIDLDNAAPIVCEGALGIPSPRAIVRHSNGKLYIASRDPAHLVEFSGGVVSYLAAGIDRDLYVGVEAPSGMLYFGTYPDGAVESYDPATDTYADLGQMDESYTSAQYAYSIAADDTHVYVLLGQATWYLAVYEIATGIITLHFKNEPHAGELHRASDGSENYYRYSAAGVVTWYRLLNGDVDAIAANQVKPLAAWNNDNGFPHSEYPVAGYEIDLTLVDVSENNDGLIRYRETGGEWQDVVIDKDAIQLAPIILKRVYSVANRLLVLPYGYNAVFWRNADSSQSIEGISGYSLYDALIVSDSEIYLSGYTSATLRWNPRQTWQKGINPYKIPLAIGKYHHFSALGSNGLIYVAARHERNSVGGHLGWYNPATEAIGDNRADFANLSPRGLVACGNYIVYSGQTIDGTDGQIVVVDTADNSIAFTHTPILGNSNAGYIVRVSDTEIIGIVDTTAYRMQIETGEIIWQKTLPATAFGTLASSERRAEIAPDNKIYLYCGTNIYALDLDGNWQFICAGGSVGAIMWHQGNAYIYQTTELRRL